MRLMRWLLLAALFLVGCGGATVQSGGEAVEVPIEMKALIDGQILGVNTENIAKIMETLSSTYMDDCRVRGTIQQEWTNAFSIPNYSLTIQSATALAVTFDRNAGTGTVDIEFGLREWTPAQIRDFTQRRLMYFRKEGDIWFECGNQLCSP